MDIKNNFNVQTLFGHNEANHLESRYTLSDLFPISRYNTPKMTTEKIEQLNENVVKLKIIDEKFTIDYINKEDTEEVLDLLKKNFFKDEPLNKYLDLGECEELEEYAAKCLPENCSFKAVNNDNKIIGVCINSILVRPKSDEEPIAYDSEKIKHHKFRKIIKLMCYVEDQYNVFDYYSDVNKALDAKIWSVDSNYRGMGIAGKLTDRTMDFMRENEIPVIHVICSSRFSAKVLEKINFEEVYRLTYADYLVDGIQVFAPDAPHDAVRILVKRL